MVVDAQHNGDAIMSGAGARKSQQAGEDFGIVARQQRATAVISTAVGSEIRPVVVPLEFFSILDGTGRVPVARNPRTEPVEPARRARRTALGSRWVWTRHERWCSEISSLVVAACDSGSGGQLLRMLSDKIEPTYVDRGVTSDRKGRESW
ncbi:hypothetical protein DFH07DRAFT_941838 [Mycena maculata]|uniref:Uncharacterized protein n=1 Tax=Mycena maculata TaxID=230809 RepID=A0AAD7IXG9_9AGAR|nr:hypothetical protein DFH07DRAFT_941838 [Mycena maculata]